MTPTLRAVAVPDHAERWTALGFEVIAGAVLLPGVRVVLDAPRIAVAIEGVASLPDGLELEPAEPAAPAYSAHPNTAIGIDHVVAVTPDFDATAAAARDRGTCRSSESATPAASARGSAGSAARSSSSSRPRKPR